MTMCMKFKMASENTCGKLIKMQKKGSEEEWREFFGICGSISFCNRFPH